MGKKQSKSGTKVRKRSGPKKRKKGGGGGGGEHKSSGSGESGGGGGGVLMSMRGGFKKAGRAVTGTGEQKKPSSTSKILNYALTIGLLVLLAYLVWRRFLQ